MPVTTTPIRKKRVPTVPKLVASSAVYIDPLNCDSTITWKIVSRKNLWGDVQLADCNKKIEWFFANHNEAEDKINLAIATLTEFRDKFVAARAARKVRTTKNPGRNKD